MKKPSNSNKKKIINKSTLDTLDKRYNILGGLGGGHSSKVYKVLDTVTKKKKAVKIFEDDSISEFRTEESILKKINEYNINSIIKFYEAGFGHLTIDGNTQEKYYIVLEYARKGNLLKKLEKTSHGFSEDVCKYIFYKILKIVKALHEKGICHRDLKPENILLFGANYDFKLCDFGFSYCFLDDNQNKKKSKDPFGTDYYRAPEVYENKLYDPEKVDIFSIGALLFGLMTKKQAFDKAQTLEFAQNEVQKLYNLIKEKQIDTYWFIVENIFNIKNLSKEFKELFIKLVSYNPSERPSFEEIMNSDWMKEIKGANEEHLNNLKDKMKSEMET